MACFVGIPVRLHDCGLVCVWLRASSVVSGSTLGQWASPPVDLSNEWMLGSLPEQRTVWRERNLFINDRRMVRSGAEAQSRCRLGCLAETGSALCSHLPSSILGYTHIHTHFPLPLDPQKSCLHLFTKQLPIQQQQHERPSWIWQMALWNFAPDTYIHAYVNGAFRSAGCVYLGCWKPSCMLQMWFFIQCMLVTRCSNRNSFRKA